MDFDLSREWLETNGIGGYASSTVINCNSRRYHALLCAATKAPQERTILVSKADETLSVGAQHFDLGANQWPGAIDPRGFQWLKEFHLDPLPRWIFEIPLENNPENAVLRLEKTIWMLHGQNTTVVQYHLLEGPPCQVSVRPFVTGRDYHGTHKYNPTFNTHCETIDGYVSLRPYEHLPAVVFSHEGEFQPAPLWYCNFEWEVEAERGLDFHEDAWSPGNFVFRLREEKSAIFALGTAPPRAVALVGTRDNEIERRRQLAGRDFSQPSARLKLAADQTVVRREDKKHTVLAGYHWFTDWGRDTMIALPGLTLSTGRPEIARSILLAFAESMSQGMIPNRFPEAGEVPDYNTVDATLWFFHAVARYLAVTEDWDLVRELFPQLAESIEWHLAGTRFGIKADPTDGLLSAGDSHSQLTWMDAKVGDVAFTPRNGKPVEIQALWYGALRETATWAARFNYLPLAGICTEWSLKVAQNFAPTFWNADAGCLFDFVDGSYKDGAIRPNQIFAVSLPHRLLGAAQEKLVVEVVQRELLTPYGLRSLSPRDSRYRGTYRGGQWERDSAYHQGTVWAWPIGGFFSAYLNVHAHSETAKNQVRVWLEPLLKHLDEAGLNAISEIFDGDAPHTPRGCINQAWSVAEVLRIWEELG